MPGDTEFIFGARVKPLVGADGSVEFLFAHEAPWAYGVAHDTDFELGHGAQGRPEHAEAREDGCASGSNK